MSTAINETEHIQAVAYLNEHAKTVKPATVRLTAAAIASQYNFTNPVDTEEVKTVQARLARQGQAGAQMKGISRDELAVIKATAYRPCIGRGAGSRCGSRRESGSKSILPYAARCSMGCCAAAKHPG